MNAIEPKDSENEVEILVDEFSDEVLEAAASEVRAITFTFSYVPMYCRFC
jgi:hypothetical protein